MPEAMFPAAVLVLCSERGRSEHAGAWPEHGAKCADIDGRAAAAVVRPGTGGYPSSRDDGAGDALIPQRVEPL